MNGTAVQIDKHLKKANKIALVTHQNPDGDAIGSVTAMAQYLLALKKTPRIFCDTEVPERLKFLNHTDLISQNKDMLTEADTIIIMDAGDLRYAGVADIIPRLAATIINIDHHPTNEKYGHINMLNAQAAATTEILYDFFKIIGAKINRDMATSLLTGLVNDTDNFSNPATTESSLIAASQLLRLGANLNLIHSYIIRNKSINTLKLWGVVLDRLTKKDGLDLVYTYLTKKDTLEYGISEIEADGIANFLNKLYGTKISLLIKETMDGKIKGSLRTTSDDTDVSLLAKKMGGGGHKKAAGFTTDGTIESVLIKITNLI
ncbi:MAG: DHH family phosphoesterase [Patescibacteria group bacterium]